MLKNIIFLLFVTSFLVQSCNISSIEDFEFSGSYALPLINTRIQIQDILSEGVDFNLKINENNTISAVYQSEILSSAIEELIPPFPSIGEVVLLDSIASLPLNSSNGMIFKKAILKGDEMRFRYTHREPETIIVKMKVPELKKNGIVLEQEFQLEYKGDIPFTAFSPSIDLAGYEFQSDENQLTFIYDARNPQGERIVLEYVAMSFNEISFEYGEGLIDRSVFTVHGNDIPVNLFGAWKSGVLEFENPKLNFSINHSYGFPIALKVNEVSLVNINNESKNLVGINVGQEILLDYPKLNEVGSSVASDIVFSGENSNINTLFNEKVKRINFNVEAIINPEGVLKENGFVTDESFFDIQVDAEIPLVQKIHELTLLDTFDINQQFPEQIKSAEFKIVHSNSYPVSFDLKVIFLDSLDNEVFSLFDNEDFRIESGILNPDGSLSQSEESIRIVPLDNDKLNDFGKIRKLVVQPVFNSPGEEEYTTFFADQYFELRMGIIIEI